MPHVVAPNEVALVTAQAPPMMAAAALKQVPELVRQAERSLQVPGGEKLQLAGHP